MTWVLKSRDSGQRTTAGLVIPTPERLIMPVESWALELKMMSPKNDPDVIGLNVTVIVQLAPGANPPKQLVLTPKGLKVLMS